MRKTLVALCGFFIACGIAQAQSGGGAGTLTVANAGCVSGSCVSVSFGVADPASATIQLTGTFVGTVQFEGSADGGTTFVALNGTPLNSATPASSATAVGTFVFHVGSLTDIRARCSAYTSGTVVVNIRSSKAPA
jgi:hypothetical protein